MLAYLNEMLLMKLVTVGVRNPHGRADDIADLPPIQTLGFALLFNPGFDILLACN